MKNTKSQRGAVSPPILIGIGLGVVVIVLLVLFFATDIFKKSSEQTNTTNTTTTTQEANVNKGTPAQPLATTPYTDSTYNYSIQYPESWQRDTDDNITAIYISDEEDTSNSALVTINASTFPTAITQATFDEVVKESREALNQFTNLEYLADKSNNKGTTFGHIFEHTTTQEGVDIHSLQLIYMKGTQTYVLTGQSITSSWSKFENTLNAMFDTFKIL